MFFSPIYVIPIVVIVAVVAFALIRATGRDPAPI